VAPDLRIQDKNLQASTVEPSSTRRLEETMSRAQVSAEDLHRVLEEEVRKLSSGADWARWLDAAALFPTYGFGNVVLITLQMPDASWVAGGSMWGTLGREVMRSRGIKILAPIRARSGQASDLDDTQGQESDVVADGQVHEQVIGFRVATVWDVTHTVGPPIPLPSMPTPTAGSAPTGLWEALEHEATADGYTVLRTMTGDHSEGFTDYRAKEIVVAEHLDEVTAVARLAHEVGHMRLHSAPDVRAAGSVICHGIREVEAESVAYIVLAHHGLTIEGSSFPYVANWAASVDPREPEQVIKATGARVVNAARQIIDSTSQYPQPGRPGAGQALSASPGRGTESLILPTNVHGPEL
jgi:hypothetical protein